ncbi:MAG: hypothetical protein GX660_27440 [Clostridiaceae bacterium]|nr:hypothetical protein [Clostridiaceae bacterium]
MNCSRVIEMIEEYIMGELDRDSNLAIEKHLSECSSCRLEYEELKETIGSLHDLKNSIRIREDIMMMNKRSIVKNYSKKRRPVLRGVSVAAAGMFLVMFLISSTIIVFPTFAYNYVPELPVVKQIKEVEKVKLEIQEIKQENQDIKKENMEIKEENEKLKMEIKEIKGEKITEITTSEGINKTDNNMIQELVVDFIKAQYKGDLEALKKMCTNDFKKQLDKNSSHIVGNKKGNVIFSTITNVAKEGDVYLVFVRVNDDIEADDADYQWNFELEKIDGKFFVSFVGLDA